MRLVAYLTPLLAVGGLTVAAPNPSPSDKAPSTILARGDDSEYGSGSDYGSSSGYGSNGYGGYSSAVSERRSNDYYGGDDSSYDHDYGYGSYSKGRKDYYGDDSGEYGYSGYSKGRSDYYGDDDESYGYGYSSARGEH
ncbi:hypothetical protein HKX48_001396, partial [Thoreauomyces humboldtii]